MKDKNNRNTIDQFREMQGGNPAVPTRVQKPKDAFGFGGGRFTPGRAPMGGYQAVWDFSGNGQDYKNSPVSKPEKGSV